MEPLLAYQIQERIQEEARSRAGDLRIPEKYVDTAVRLEGLMNIYPRQNRTSIDEDEKEFIIKNVMGRASFLQGVYNIATIKGVNPRYIDKQLIGKYDKKIGDVRNVDLGKMDKKVAERIINRAIKLQKKEKK